MNMVRRAWDVSRRAVFRVGIPRTDLGRAQATVSSFVLHLHPAKVHRHSLRPSRTFGLGLISLFLFVILTVSGVLLMFHYVPSVERAYESMKDLGFVITAGRLLRNVHRWAAHLMVVAVVLHMARVFLMGAYKPPREFNWILGVMLLIATLFLSFTGYLLPWDQLAFWAITVGTSIAAYAPVVGEGFRYVLLGGNEVGQAALLRFYVLHCVVLPGFVAFVAAVHLFRIRKDGGLARPDEDMSVAEEGEFPPEEKTYGLMALTEAPAPAAGGLRETHVFTWPHLLIREVTLFAATFAVVLAMSLLVDAPLEERANPVHPPNPAKAPWYFLGLQELVAHSALIGGVLVPGAAVLILFLVPFIDRRRKGVGVWFSRDRWLANSLFLLALIAFVALVLVGTYFRGPDWQWVWPWAPGSGTGS